MADVYDERDEAERKLNLLEEKINSIEEWLNQYGWAKKQELPDFMAANCRSHMNGSLADMVYELIRIKNEP